MNNDLQPSRPVSVASCCRNGRKEAAEFLLQRAADMEAEAENGDRPMHVATNYGLLGCSELLLEKPVRKDVAQRDGNGF